MTRHLLQSLLVCLCALACPSVGLRADDDAATPVATEPASVLLLTNGDRLHGDLGSAQDDVIQWRVADGLEFPIPIGSVQSVQLVGQARTWTPAMGIDALTAEPAPAPAPDWMTEDPLEELRPELAEPEVEEEDPLETAMIPLVNPRVVFRRTYELTKRIELGGTFVDGNSESDSLNVGGELGRKTDELDETIKFGGFVSTADDALIANRWWVNANVDYTPEFCSPWFFFLTSRNQYDEFENLDYRGTFSGGPGYRFVDEPDREITVRGGPGVTMEFFRDPYRDEYTPDLFGQLEVKHPLGDRLVFESDTIVNPTIDDFRVFRVVSQNGLLLPLDESRSWNLKMGLQMEYHSDPNPGRKRADVTSTLLLVYKRN